MKKEVFQKISLGAGIAGLMLSLYGCVSYPTGLDRALLNIQTNSAPVLYVFTNALGVVGVGTNMEQRVVATPNAPAQSITDSIGLMFPGWGTFISTALAGVLGVYARNRARAFNEAIGQKQKAEDAAAEMAQNIEVARNIINLLPKTPEGQQVADNYRKWLIDHQAAAGVIDVVTEMVKNYVDPSAATGTAVTLVGPAPSSPTSQSNPNKGV